MKNPKGPKDSPPAAPSARAKPLLVLPREGTRLVEGRLIARRQRFLADVELLNPPRRVVAHCVNTGSMEGLVRPGARVWLSAADSPTRRLAWTWELVEIDGHLVGANTSLPNRLVRRLIEARCLPLPGLRTWKEMKPEAAIGADKRRADFRLDGPGDQVTWIEVKNCHLAYEDRCAYFPDSVSERATHHLEELSRRAEAGDRAMVLFTCQVPNVAAVRPSDVHDPAFAAAARDAARRGVKFAAVQVHHTLAAITIEGTLVPVDLKPYPTEPVAAWRDAMRAAEGRPPLKKRR